jgi:hypothetical protein
MEFFRILLIVGMVIPCRADSFSEKVVPLLDQHCYQCHGEKKQKGGIELHQIKTTEDAYRTHRFLNNVADQIKSGDMPPEDDVDALPTAEERALMVREIEGVMAHLKKGDFPRKPGRPTVRRLNRNEYNNTVRDLFGISFLAGQEFPADGAGGEGFDNVGDSLFIPPVLMEKYVQASRKVVDAIYAQPALQKRVIFRKPQEKEDPLLAARVVLVSHASLAFRRRLSEEDVAHLMELYQQALKRGESYENAFRAPLRALLIHPAFLFRWEADQPGQKEWKVDSFELATRLSYFLWASMPDRTLFQLADQGKLSDPMILQQQVLRMLDDPRSDTLARYFAGQWLGFDELRESVTPDAKRFPMFTESLRIAMYRESVEFFHHIQTKNRPITELLDSKYTFVNEELARHYGMPGVTGSQMRLVPISDPQRGGVIGQASILTATSLPLRTSPVKRGKWILDTILGTPPPPPPPDAGELPADDKSSEGLSFRQQLELHRQKPNCAGCHEKIDPLGFGLENFDAIGRWRSHDANGKKVDSVAALPGDIVFSTPAELKKLLVESNELFCKNFCRKLLGYSLGRPLEYYDEPVIDQLYQTLVKQQYQIRPVILAIVQSHPFLSRGTER